MKLITCTLREILYKELYERKSMLKKIIIIGCILIIFVIFKGIIFSANAENSLSGKDIFYTVKGPYGSCNTCHPGGGSAGRWDTEYEEIDDEGDKKIPVLKGIGKKKTPEQIKKAIKLVRSKYKVPVKDEQLDVLVEYVSSL